MNDKRTDSWPVYTVYYIDSYKILTRDRHYQTKNIYMLLERNAAIARCGLPRGGPYV